MAGQLKIGIPKEIYPGETRVSLVPKMILLLKKNVQEVLVETGAGDRAFFTDDEYEKAGARIISDAESLFGEADVIFKVQPLRENPAVGKHEVDMLKPGSTFIGFINPEKDLNIIQLMCEKKITSFSLQYIPRTARAQGMDVLSSMASVSGYRAVLIAAQYLGKLFPLMMTAAGTIPPAHALIVGAGVAGLQAIATARRLGARVEAFDVRYSVKEQVESLGAKFIELQFIKDAETTGGYAKAISDDLLHREREVIRDRLVQNDVVITTAQTIGRKAPVLITEDMVRQMKRGSVIVDMAAEQGGNCEVTEAGKTITKYDVTICGAVNLPATLPVDASQMYSRNIVNFFLHIYKGWNEKPDFNDDIVKSTCITYNGTIKNETVRDAFEKKGKV